MKHGWLLIVLTSIVACTAPTDPEIGEGEGASAGDADSSFVGEYRYADGAGRITFCGERTEHLVGGRGADSLELVCALGRTASGQRTKVWVEGRLVPGGEEGTATLDVSRLLHHSASLRCPALPDAELAGRYEGDLPGLAGSTRALVLDLFADGKAFTASPDVEQGRMAEDEGTWGVDSDGVVEVKWPTREVVHQYRHAHGELLFKSARIQGEGLVLRRQGAPERLWGSHGEVMALLAELSGQQGRPLAASDIDPDASLASYFPDEAGRAELHRSIAALVGGEPRGLEQDLALAATPAELVQLVRRFRPRGRN